jgi:putative transposase
MDDRTETVATEKPLPSIVSINEDEIHRHLSEMVRANVEEALNAALEAEAEGLCRAGRYERSPDRVDTRAGHYGRKLQTKAGEVKLQVPKLRKLPFETQIIERYRRRESSVEEALVEMYLAGVSVRRVEDITEALWGTRVKPSTVSDLNQKIFERIEAWRTSKIHGKHPYVFLDGIWLKRSWGGEVKNLAVLVAMGVNGEGYREILGVAEGNQEDKQSWLEFLRYLKRRGLKGVRLLVSDKCLGLVEALGQVYPAADWQRCTVHWYRNVLKEMPNRRRKEVAAMLKAIHGQEDAEAAREKVKAVEGKLKKIKLRKAAKLVAEGAGETLAYMQYPREHWRQVRTNNPLERLMKEIRRRTRVVGSFPDGQSALMLAAARLRHVAGTKWGRKKYLNMDRLWELEAETNQEAPAAVAG